MTTTERQAVREADLPEIMSMDEVGQYLRVSRSTAYELARRKDFPAFLLGTSRGLRVRRDSFLEWVKNQSR